MEKTISKNRNEFSHDIYDLYMNNDYDDRERFMARVGHIRSKYDCDGDDIYFEALKQNLIESLFD